MIGRVGVLGVSVYSSYSIVLAGMIAAKRLEEISAKSEDPARRDTVLRRIAFGRAVRGSVAVKIRGVR